jgi:hypothetical protein
MFVDKAWSQPRVEPLKYVLHSFRLRHYSQALDWARKACKEQTLQLIGSIDKLQRK